MSKVNYAKIRNSQKRADTNPEEKTLAPTSSLEVHSSACGSLAVAEKTSFPLAPPKIESSNLTNLFGDNVHMDNLDYINSLLGNQFAGNTGVPQKRKKTKPKLDDSGSQPKLSDKVIMPSSPAKANDPLNVPLNSPGLDPSSSIISPYEIENNHVMENIDRLGDNEERAQLRAARNMSNMISRKDVEMYEEYFQNDVNKDIGKRSMSVEDVRILKRDFSKASASAKAHGFAETEGDGLEDDSVYMTTDPTPASIMQDFGHNRPLKSDFSSKIGQYIDYFQKSEQSQYRMRKASQYLGTNPNQVNSRTESQRSGQSRSNDVEKMMSQIKKLKAKVDELQVTNELLLNERKTWKKMEHEIVYRAQNAETEIAKAHSKAKKYKEKLKYTQELLQREKLDNENNLLALRRVLANNISTVLEHKIHHYMNSDRDKPYLEQARMSNSEKGGATKKVTKDKDYRKNTLSNVNPMLPGSTNQTRDMRYGEGNNVKNRWKNTSLKDKMSPLLSQKDQSFSDDDENPPERLTTLSKSDELDAEEASNKNKRFPGYSPRQSDFETSSELTDEFQYYFYGNHQEPSKKLQQIQYLQNQLTKLMEKDENLSQSTSNYSKSVSQRNADQMISSKQRTNPSSSYSKKAREPTYSKLNNYTKQHEHVRLYRKDLDDTLSPNEALNHPSFSNSESGWTTSLGK